MFVKDYMLDNVCTISPDSTVYDALQIMVDKKTNGLVVVDNTTKEIAGTVSSFTIAKAIIPDFLKDDPNNSIYEAEGVFDEYAKKASSVKIEEVMCKDVHILTDDDAMIEAAAFSTHADQRLMPVVKKGTNQIVGIVTRTSIKNAYYQAIKNSKDKVK